MRRGKRSWKKLIAPFLGICMTMAFSLTAMAEDYTYTVTLSTGNMGTVNGEDKITVEGIRSGAEVTFDVSQVQVTDERYYVKGVRLSGRDNADAQNLVSPTFTVDGDADYVVAYGIRGDMVAYTVNYQDADGNELAPSQQFYGNVGDKPVVAYRYIDGYIPQAAALTKTLSSNEAENVFTFVYEEGESGTVVETPGTPGGVTTVVETVIVTEGTGAAAGTGTAAGAGTAGTGAAGAGTAGAGAGAAGAGTGAAGTAEGGDTTTIEGEDVPQGDGGNVVDLDEEDTPLGNIDVDESGADSDSGSGFPLAGSIAVGVIAVAILAALIVFLVKAKR